MRQPRQTGIFTRLTQSNKRLVFDALTSNGNSRRTPSGSTLATKNQGAYTIGWLVYAPPLTRLVDSMGLEPITFILQRCCARHCASRPTHLPPHATFIHRISCVVVGIFWRRYFINQVANRQSYQNADAANTRGYKLIYHHPTPILVYNYYIT